MKQSTRRDNPIKTQLVLALFAAVMTASQVAMASLPNIEIVSFLVILLGLFYGFKALEAIYIFVLLEGLIYGFGMWWFSYLYVWLILFAATQIFRKVDSALFWAAISGAFGLLFGTFCSLPTFITGGFAAGIAWIASGLVFDVIHAVGNFVIMLLLYRPMFNTVEKLYKS